MSTAAVENDFGAEVLQSPFATASAEGLTEAPYPSGEPFYGGVEGEPTYLAEENRDPTAGGLALAGAETAGDEWEQAGTDPQDGSEAFSAEAGNASGASASMWQPIVRIAFAGGLRDENNLTNLVFFARHPGRHGRKLSRDEPAYASLSAEWLRIRDTIVRPVVDGTRPGSTPVAGAAMGPFSAVATRFPSGATATRYGIPETVEALAWIEKEWARRHPEVRFGVNDISKLGGGQLGRHKSHRIGLDADVNLTVKGRRIGVKNADYERQRPLVQELVTLIRDNPVLPIKTIGFNDPKMPDVAQWAGHTKHLHVRFCRPARYATQLDLDRAYAKGEAKPNYDCSTATEFEDGDLDLYYEYEDDEGEGGAADDLTPASLALEGDEATEIVALAAERLDFPAQELEGFFEPLRRLARPFGEAIMVVRTLHAGRRDEDGLTNLVFFNRYPSRGGRKLSPDEPGFQSLRNEWLQIRDALVRPLLWSHIRTEAKRIALDEWRSWRLGNLSENDPAVQGRLRQYWNATPHIPVGAGIWQESWSAAFISWVLREAGAGPSFAYHNAHRVYVHRAIRNVQHDPSNPIRAFPAEGPDRVRPRVGDLVCSWRENSPISYVQLAAMAQPPAGQAMHCDVVTEVGPDHIEVVGGNKSPAAGVVCPANHSGCTVNRARHDIASGFLVPLPGNARGWIAVVQIGP